MPFEFFVSYSRANNDAYLKRFMSDLAEAVSTVRGVPLSTAVGYFDQREILLGEDWDADIVAGLQTSKVLLSLYSPAYFKSEYCAKEHALFS